MWATQKFRLSTNSLATRRSLPAAMATEVLEDMLCDEAVESPGERARAVATGLTLPRAAAHVQGDRPVTASDAPPWLCASDCIDIGLHLRKPAQCRCFLAVVLLAAGTLLIATLTPTRGRLDLRSRLWQWLFERSPASPMLETLLEPSHAAMNCRRPPPLAGAWFAYCGPQNGDDFARAPRDVLDTICAQHDYCIEKSYYAVNGQPRRIYPMGHVDADNMTRCGIPIRSHTNPKYGCQIAACDREILASFEVCVYVCLHALLRMYECVYVYAVNKHTRTRARAHTHTHTHTCPCTHTHTCTHTCTHRRASTALPMSVFRRAAG